MGLDTSPEKPAPVRVVSHLLGQWIAKLGRVWVEGQVTSVSRRPGARTVYLSLRDPVADVSLSVTCPTVVLDRLPTPLGEGASVVVSGRPDFYPARGTLSLAVTEIRPVGIGELLLRLEQLKQTLAAEGLFASDRKRALPFLPRTIGLVCGRASAAERDVVENTQRRWPGARFAIREVAVQGVNAVSEVSAAVRELDTLAEVEVIIVTRGGGSVEDLLPFSNEALLRTVSACRTPVVSAIGHETDSPLLDLVADHRASTPTDAARCVVPDFAEEVARIDTARARLRRGIEGLLHREESMLVQLRSRPVLAAPATTLDLRAAEVTSARDRARRCLAAQVARAEDELLHVRARVRTLSPQATLDRGYAVVQLVKPGRGKAQKRTVVRDAKEVASNDRLEVRVAAGSFAATVVERT